LSIPDYIITGMLIWGFISGFRKGLVFQLALIAGIIGGLWLALHGSEKAACWLEDETNLKGEWMQQLGFVLVFAGIYVLSYLGGKALSGALNLMMLGLINKLAGGVFGVFRMILIVSGILFFLQLTGWVNQDMKIFKESAMYGSLNGFGEQLYQLIR
jgi:membrane protein required for colicin V production